MSIIYHRGEGPFYDALLDLAMKIKEDLSGFFERDKKHALGSMAIFSGMPGRCRLVIDCSVDSEEGSFERCRDCHYGDECTSHLTKSRVVLAPEDFDNNPRNIASLWIVLSSRECSGIKAIFENEQGCIAGILFEPEPEAGSEDCLVLLDELALHKIIVPGLATMIKNLDAGNSVKDCARAARKEIEANFAREIQQTDNHLLRGMLVIWLSSLV